jgi:DNA polymerase III subunit tau-like protein
MPVPQAADAGSVDVAMLRRSWPSLMQHLGESGKQVVRASLESATVASFDGQTLELAFPPDRRFAVQKIESREDVLRQALQDLFGISPKISCVVRGSREAGAPPTAEVVEEDETPDEAEALRRVQEMLGATPIEGGE